LASYPEKINTCSGALTFFSREFANVSKLHPKIKIITSKQIIMKSIFLLFAGSFFSLFTFGQLKVTPTCPPFAVDIMAGNVNKLYPKSSLGEIQKAFPCMTDVVEKATDTRCAGVFDKEKGLFFFTERNYIEITENFKGKITPALMGASRSSLFSMLGYPKLKDTNWDAFQTEYGTLILYYNKDAKINKIQITSKGTESLKLCE